MTLQEEKQLNKIVSKYPALTGLNALTQVNDAMIEFAEFISKEKSINFVNWFLLNSENYYANISTVEDLYNQFLSLDENHAQ